MAKLSDFNPHDVVSYTYPETIFSYTERDVAVYALGVGVCGTDAVDSSELKYVYHEDGQRSIKVLPTFSTLFTSSLMPKGYPDVPAIQYDPRLLLHGQQYIEIYKPLPSSSSVKNSANIVGLHDKGKAAVVEIENRSYGEETGSLLCMNRFTVYLRGAGGFSKTSSPFSYSNYPTNQVSTVKIPKLQPFAVYEDHTRPSQALLYRLSGDYNPLHSDPALAKTAGFSYPILHGLCTLGFSVRAVIKCICRGDSELVKSILGRFLLYVYPGETLITEMWLEGKRVIYQTKVKERNQAVLAGYIDIRNLPSSL